MWSQESVIKSKHPLKWFLQKFIWQEEDILPAHGYSKNTKHNTWWNRSICLANKITVKFMGKWLTYVSSLVIQKSVTL